MKNEYLKIFLFLFLVLVLFFAKPIFQGLSLVPAETLYHIDNIYKGLASKAENLPGNGLLFDLVFQMYPWQYFIHQSIQGGFIPLWNPYSLAGLPFLANDQSSIFEITKLASYLFQIPAKDLILFSGFLTLLLAGFFTYLFTRNLKLNKISSLVSALAFMFSGPVIVWLGYPLTSTVIWLPFLLLCIDKIIKQPQKLWIGLFALAIGFQFFGGNPEISWFILFISALYALFRLNHYRPYKNKYKIILRKSGLLIIALFLGLAIASIQIIPTLEFLKQSEALSVGRGGVAGTNFFQIISQEWNSWHNLKDIKHSLENFVLLVYPDFFGNPVLKQYWGWLNYNESALYVGIIPLIFALIALAGIFKKAKGKKKLFFWISVSFICFGAFVSLPILRLIAYLPVFKITAIGRLRFIFVFALAILAGYGIDYFLKSNQKKQAKKKWIIFNIIYLAIIFLVVLAVWIWRKFTLQSVTQEMWYSEKILFLVIFILINIILWLLLFSQIRSWKYNLGKILLILLVAGELFYYGYNYHPAIPHNFVYPQTSAIQFLQDNIGHYRLTSYKESLENFSSSLLPNSSILWSLQDIRGYEIIKVKRYEAFERHFGGLDNRFIYKFFDHKIFNTLGVRYFVQGKDDPENTKLASIKNLPLVYIGESINIYENKEVMPRAFVVFNIHPVKDYYQAIDVFVNESFKPEMVALIETRNPENLSSIYNNHPFTPYQSAKITNYSPHKIEIITEASKDGYLVLTDAYYPGWQAYLDGREVKIYPTNIAFRGLFVPQGKHQIIFKYHPNSFYYSIYISIIALVISLLLIMMSLLTKSYRSKFL
jgi:hypothetical protein